MAWQVLFVLGALYAREGPSQLKVALRSRAALTTAILFPLFSFVVVLSWRVEAVEWFFPEALASLFYPIDKSNLAPLRLLHFLSLAVVASHRDVELAWTSNAADDRRNSLR